MINSKLFSWKHLSCVKIKFLSVFLEFIDYLYMGVVGLWYTAPAPSDIELHHFK